jgi:periplasmic protein CpxP/Spy
MKRIACKFTYPTLLAVSVVLLAFMVLASPSPSRAASSEPGMATSGKVSRPEGVEARIKELQTKLKITPAQEDLWNNVTQVMRDNAKTMEALIKARSKEVSTMTAIDDLKSYGEIVEAHADAIRKFIPAFEPLYVGMSDAQKKAADTLFRHHERTKSKAKRK